jgi:hypothetical protein
MPAEPAILQNAVGSAVSDRSVHILPGREAAIAKVHISCGGAFGQKYFFKPNFPNKKD